MKQWGIFALGVLVGICFILFNIIRNDEHNGSIALDEIHELKSSIGNDCDDRISNLEGQIKQLNWQIGYIYDACDVNDFLRAKRMRIEVLKDRRYSLFVKVLNARNSVQDESKIGDWEKQMKQIDQELDRLTADVNK